MSKSIPRLTNNIYIYKAYKKLEVLSVPINIQKLPVTGESKIFKQSAERYGHVIVKLDIETDEEIKRRGVSYYSYEWKPEAKCEGQNDIIIPLDDSFEDDILNELKFFTTLLALVNENTTHLRFSIVGGSHRRTERPFFGAATAEALIQIMKKLSDSNE